MNSLKMKMSVLFGVTQMVIGLFLRFGNAIYEKNRIDLVFECIPMMIFMVGYFGYMNWMILTKWVHVDENPKSIINCLISLSMQTGSGDPEDKFWKYENYLL